MHKSKLLELFKYVEKEELKELEKFVSSPFFNTDPKVGELFSYIRKYHGNLESPRLTKQFFIKKAYKKNPALGNRRINYLMSDLSGLIEEYWLLNELKSMEQTRERLMLKTLKKRKAEKQFFKYFERLKLNQDNRKERGAYFYYHEFAVNHEMTVYDSNIKSTKEEDYLQVSNHSLDSFYFVTKLRYIMEMVNLNKITAKNYAIPDLDRVKQFAELVNTDELPHFQIYWHLINYLKNQDLETYQLVKPTIYENFHLLETEDRFDTMTAILNTTYFRYTKSGSKQDLKEVFELFQFALKTEAFHENNILPSEVFNNVTSIGCQLKEFDWLERFFDTYSGQLKPEDQENVLAYNRGFVAVHRKQFDLAIQHMRSIDFDKRYILVAKSLLLRCYYELPEYDIFYYDYCRAYEQFLRRNTDFPKNQIKAYLSFIQIARKLHKLKSMKSDEKQKILIEIDEFEAQPSLKKWLKEKWEEL